MPGPYFNNHTLPTIQAMRNQEENGYRATMYLHQQQSQLCSGHPPVDAECREKMSEWSYQVVDYCGFQREIVEIAMSNLDRYLSTERGQDALFDRRKFQLVAMTCLYTAIKVHEEEAVTPHTMAHLSRSTCTGRDFEQCELDLLQTLQWRVNPPTSTAFLRNFMDLIPSTALNNNARSIVMRVAQLQVELAVNRYEFVGINASTIALAAISNALVSEMMDNSILHDIALAAGIDVSSRELDSVEEILFHCIESFEAGWRRSNSDTADPSCGTKTAGCNASRSIHSSPRCVSHSR